MNGPERNPEEPDDLDRKVSSEATGRTRGEPARLRSGKEYHRERQDHEAQFGFVREHALRRLDGRAGRADDYLPASATDPGIVYEYKHSNLASQAARNTLSRNVDRHPGSSSATGMVWHPSRRTGLTR